MTRWIPLRDAATALAVSQAALRKIFERRAELGSDGVLEATVDGVHARKFGGRWRVSFSEQWAQAGVLGSTSQARGMRGRGDRP